MDCSPPASSVHEIFWAIILEWLPFPTPGEFSWTRDQSQASCVSCIGKWILYHWAPWDALSALLMEMQVGRVIMKKNVVVIQKTKNRTTSNSTPGYISGFISIYCWVYKYILPGIHSWVYKKKKTPTQKNTCISIFIAALFAIADI